MRFAGASKNPIENIAPTRDMSTVKPCVTEVLGNVRRRSFLLEGISTGENWKSHVFQMGIRPNYYS